MSKERSVLAKLQGYMGTRRVLLPLAIIVSGLSSLAALLPFIFIWLITRELFAPTCSYDQIRLYAWWAVTAAVTGIALYFAALTLSHLAAFRVEINLRKESMRRIMKMPLGFFNKHTSGSIRKIIDENAGITHMFLAHQLPDVAGSIIPPLATLALLFALDWRLGLACLIPLLTGFAVMGFMMRSAGQKFMRLYMDSLEEMNTEAVEYVRGIPVVKVFQQTPYSFTTFHKSIIKYLDMEYAYTLKWEKPMSAYMVIIHSFAFVLVPAAILMINSSGNYAGVLVDLLLYVLITPVFANSIMKSMYLSQALGNAREAVNRIENLLDYRELENPQNPQPITAYSVDFKNVSFSYPGSQKKAIDGVSFSIPQGKTYALVGASGGGKTSIARLIPRFWDPDEGTVSIGDCSVKNIATPELMDNISFVFQNTKLFKMSLLDNIRYGRPDATFEEIDRAVDLARAREIIDRLPAGLGTVIGAAGTYLSGGEQQRIVLARAILKNAPIVVLDEATAFADPENEHLIQKALKELMKGKTVLMIAHRLTSIRDVDQILVIHEGRVAEQGTHAELLARNGSYLKMWNEYQKAVQWTIESAQEACHA